MSLRDFNKFNKYQKIRSKDRESHSTSETDFYLRTFDMMHGTYRLCQVIFPLNFYNVNSTNDTIYYTTSTNGAQSGTIANGFYTTSTIASAVETTLNSGADSDFTVSYSATTGKLTITKASGTVSFTFATNTTTSARKILGFDEEDTSTASPVSSTNPILLNYTNSLHIDIDRQPSIEYARKGMTTFTIPLSGTNQEFLVYEPSSSFRQTLNMNKPNIQIRVKVQDDDGNVIENQGGEWEMTLEKID